MSFQWPVDAEDLFGERYPQMVNTGLPAPDVDAVRAAITQMWTDAPGGWVYEWSALAARYAGEGSHQRASLAYGWAKFPTLADDSKRFALRNQLDQYLLAAPDFGVDFTRRVLDVPYRDASTPVPVHIFAAPDLPADAPVLLASGGVDSWKMDMHNMFVLAAATAGVRVVAFDIAGTGESAVPMTPDGGAEIVRGLIAEARTLGNGIVSHLGISMGGYYSARSGRPRRASAPRHQPRPARSTPARSPSWRGGRRDRLRRTGRGRVHQGHLDAAVRHGWHRRQRPWVRPAPQR